MAEVGIKSGEEVVSEFLEAIEGNAAVDPDTLSAIQTLRSESKLSKVALLKSLQTHRERGNTNGKD